MREDKTRWDERYRTRAVPDEPSGLLMRHIGLLAGKKVLDVAAGTGRHAKILAEHGCLVDALEWSDVALARLGTIENVTPIEVDLDRGPYPEGPYDAIVCINYLNRNLYPYFSKALKKNGILLFETFVASEANEGAPGNPLWLLEKNELLRVFCHFYIFEYEERFVTREDGRRTLKAFLAARNVC
ncbi:class I SAM-dependent methyltransferase [Hydrogenimonas sp. SS33]|uniref:class I SAM-dependent methyltransferase n=1 Tax=Hydrogenimonas leucolamina TaxID=2954236 RepID=UPI00336C0335